MADFDPLYVGASVQTYPGLAIHDIRLESELFNSLLGESGECVAVALVDRDRMKILREPSGEASKSRFRYAGRASL